MELGKDKIRELVGGYATGSLTDAERRLLMDAALDDQDLFDELMREQELMALLDQPGAKPRLIAAVSPQKRRSMWLWGTLVGAAAAALITLMVWPNDPEPQLMAKVEQPEAPAPPPAPQMRPTPAPAPRIARSEAPAPPPLEQDRALDQERRADTALPPPVEIDAAKGPPPPPEPVRPNAPAPVPPPAAPKPAAFVALGTVTGTVIDPTGAAIVGAAVTATNQQTGDSFTASSSVTGAFAFPNLPVGQYQLGAAQPGFRQFQTAFAVTPEQSRQFNITLEVGQAAESVTVTADASTVLKTEAAPAALKGKAGAGKGGAAPFGVTYALENRTLRLTPLANGILLVQAGATTVFPRNPVVAGPIVLAIPGDATEVTVAFAAQQGIAPANQPQRVTALAGTISGPRAQELRFVIPVQ